MSCFSMVLVARKLGQYSVYNCYTFFSYIIYLPFLFWWFCSWDLTQWCSGLISDYTQISLLVGLQKPEGLGIETGLATFKGVLPVVLSFQPL